jgi:hypothetical protein
VTAHVSLTWLLLASKCQVSLNVGLSGHISFFVPVPRFPSKSGLMNKHIVKHIVKFIPSSFLIIKLISVRTDKETYRETYRETVHINKQITVLK